MTDYEKIVKKVDDALARAGPGEVLGRLAPKPGQLYSCLNCVRFDIEIDICETEWAAEYCGREDIPNSAGERRKCPGYKPPEGGEFVFTLTPIDLSD